MQAKQITPASDRVIERPLLITPQMFGDERGFFFESWNQSRFDEAVGAPITFSQDNHSRSSRGVLRGLHYQLEPEPQGKLVRCPVGAIFDVAVDLRRSSATYGQWVSAVLSDENQQQLWVPVAFAHGFLTLSEAAEVLYKASGYWSKACERTLRWETRIWRSPGRCSRWVSVSPTRRRRLRLRRRCGSHGFLGGVCLSRMAQGRGMPRSMQVLRTNISLIPLCMGMALRLFSSDWCYHE